MSARQAIKAAREWQDNSEVAIAPEIVEDLVSELEQRLPHETMLIDVLLLCTECQQPIKARINTPQWIRVEWIGSAGECQSCYRQKKGAINADNERR